MQIDGKLIAENILSAAKVKTVQLKSRGIIPALAVILVGDNPASLSYVRQKQKAADKIGVKLTLYQFPAITVVELKKLILKLNKDKNIHGLIVQRPLPKGVGDYQKILNLVSPKKDVDGFVPNSAFEVPVAKAVLKILESICLSENFISWLKTKKIVIIGRGETAGAPIARLFQKLECAISVINSQTPNPAAITLTADILISCVGKIHTVRPEMVKPGSILISVGLTKDSEDKLHGDYEEEEIENISPFYTPTPGGVGPVNVACLMENLVSAAG